MKKTCQKITSGLIYLFQVFQRGKNTGIVQRCCSGDALKAATGGYKAKAGRHTGSGPPPPPARRCRGRSSPSNGPKAEEGHTDKQKTKTELK